MESAFAWLNQLVETFYRFFPHVLIVRATHGAVKWVKGKEIKALGPGLHIYWPLTTEVEVMVTARQTLAIPDQVLATNVDSNLGGNKGFTVTVNGDMVSIDLRATVLSNGETWRKEATTSVLFRND